MLAHDAILRIARRYDTAMAQAMMRALGFVELPKRRRRKRGHGERKAAYRARYRGMRWCFMNHGSPMDRKR